MATLADLRAQLISVQATKAEYKLTDRNIVEIVNSLIEEYDLNLIFSNTGKEYITPLHLEKEIKAEILRLGRINIVDLPQLLGVNIEHIEKIIAGMNDSAFVIVEGTLLSSVYIDGLAEEINSSLQEIGQIPIGELAHRYSLPMDILKREIEIRIGLQIQGELRHATNTLYTDVYVERHRARLRGAIRGCSGPTVIKGFDNTLVANQIKDLVSSK